MGRTAWGRLSAVVALFFAAAVVAATPPTAPAPLAESAVLQVLVVPASQVVGQRPDLPVVDHGGQRRTAPDLTGFAWLPQQAAIRTVTWWHLRRDSSGQRAQAGREVCQVRGPPGRRAADASS